jgi:hypothetical protein
MIIYPPHRTSLFFLQNYDSSSNFWQLDIRWSVHYMTSPMRELMAALWKHAAVRNDFFLLSFSVWTKREADGVITDFLAVHDSFDEECSCCSRSWALMTDVRAVHDGLGFNDHARNGLC